MRRLLCLHQFPPHQCYNDITKNFLVVPDFITIEEEKAFLEILQPKFRRRRYEGDHWDSVIVAYKETQLPSMMENPEGYYPPILKSALQRIEAFLRKITQVENMEILPYHVVDLSNDGHIMPHVDSVKFSGGMVSGLSLLSTRILQLNPCSPHDTVSNDQEQIKLELPYLELLDTKNHDQGHDLIRTSPPPPHWPSGKVYTDDFYLYLQSTDSSL